MPQACADAAAERLLVVVGSINADLVLQVARMPAAGETLEASSLSTFPGGKVWVSLCCQFMRGSVRGAHCNFECFFRAGRKPGGCCGQTRVLHLLRGPGKKQATSQAVWQRCIHARYVKAHAEHPRHVTPACRWVQVHHNEVSPLLQVGRDDANGGMLRQALQDSGVDTSQLREVPGPCGTAVIMVDGSGRRFIQNPLANGRGVCREMCIPGWSPRWCPESSNAWVQGRTASLLWAGPTQPIGSLMMG